MKHQKKNNLMPVICVLAVIVVVMIAVLAVLMLRGGDESVPEESSAKLPLLETTLSTEGDVVSAPAEQQSFGEGAEEILAAQDVDDVIIETPYTTLYYPGEWASALQVDHEEGEVYTVRFTAKLESGMSVPLFEIRLGGSVQDGFAFILADDGDVVAVNAEAYEFTPPEGMRDSEIIVVYSMQEAMNEVLAGMDLRYGDVNDSAEESAPVESDTNAQAQDVLPEDNGEEMVIDTPGGTLRYPARWANYLHLEMSEENSVVTFYCRMDGYEDLELFTVYIGGEEGMPAGTITNADGESQELRLGVEELSLDGWQDKEARVAYAMQEDLNYLLETLS